MRRFLKKNVGKVKIKPKKHSRVVPKVKGKIESPRITLPPIISPGQIRRGLPFRNPVAVEKYKFKPRRFKNKVDVEIIKNAQKTLWVIGTGYGITLLDKKLLRELNNRTTLTFHNSFPHITEYGIVPTYWTWLDPSAALPGLNYLATNQDTIHPHGCSPIKIDTIPILHPGLASNGPIFRKFFGNTLCDFENYHKLLHEVNKNYKIALVPGSSLKALNDRICKEVMENPSKRLQWGFLVGSAYVSGAHDKKGKYNAKVENGMYMTENKFSSFILPLAHYLGFKNIVYVGFEGTGPRFFEMKNFNIGAGRGGYDMGMELWSKWRERLGMRIVSLIPPHQSKTVKYFEYMNFKDALNEFA